MIGSKVVKINPFVSVKTIRSCMAHQLQVISIKCLAIWVCGAMAGPESIRLWNGVEIPSIGYGTAGRMSQHQISTAIDRGYKLIDSAQAPGAPQAPNPLRSGLNPCDAARVV